MAGRLLLVPNALDQGHPDVALTDALPAAAMAHAAGLQHWVVENAKTARAFLKRVNEVMPLAHPVQALNMVELPRPQKSSAGTAGRWPWRDLLKPALQGFDLGLLSDAGMPAIADPGAALVEAAHAEGLAVVPLSGPNAMMLALAASGLNGQSFAFVGYLPQDEAARAARIKDLEQRSRREQQTQMAIETPYRNEVLLRSLLTHLHAETRLSIACGLTQPEGWCRTMNVEGWRRGAPVIDRDRPAVFLWQAR